MKKLAIVITHPIQYYAPWFKMLAETTGIEVKVFYTWSQSAEEVKDKGFGKNISWDIPLLDGYDYEFIQNTSKKPSDQHFWGIKNPGLIKKIKSWSPNAILVFGWNFHSHLKVMRYFKGKTPVFFRGDSNLLDEQKGLKTLLRRIWLTWVYRHIDKAFYVGTNNKNYYLKHGVKQNQLVFAPHAIDNNRFDDPMVKYEQQAKDWRVKLGIKPDEIVILFCGKFEPKKNPEILINVAQEIKNSLIKFVLVGNGILETDLKEKAKNIENVRFLPFQNQSIMPVVYRLGDIFVLPSVGPGETWGLAINEAMACAKPIIASNKTGCAIDLIKENKNGYIFKAGNIQDLSHKINKISFAKEQLSKFGAVSYEIIQNWNFYNICNTIKQTLL